MMHGNQGRHSDQVNRIVASGRLGRVRHVVVEGETFAVPKFVYPAKAADKDGWNLVIERQNLTYRRYFSCNKYGGRRGALNEAITHLADKHHELQSLTTSSLKSRFYPSQSIKPSLLWVSRNHRKTYDLSLTVTLNNRCTHLHAYTTYAGTLKTLSQSSLESAYFRCIGAHHWVSKHREQGVAPDKVPPLPKRLALEKTGRRISGSCPISVDEALMIYPDS